MDDKTKQALEASIEKWRANASEKHPAYLRMGVSECPLCHLFYARNCRGCPVRDCTKKMHCKSTPYDSAAHEATMWEIEPHSKPTRDRFREAAHKEIAFLESLLPDGGRASD